MMKFLKNWRLAFVLLASLVFFSSWMPGAAWAETAEQLEEVR